MLIDTFSPVQQQALQEVEAWIASWRGRRLVGPGRVFRLFGYAGTGKTTLAKYLAATVKGAVLYACFTGKASLVLARKGCEPSSTLHSLLYRAHQDPVTGEFRFTLNHRDSPLCGASLLVVDEVSQVNEELARDALSFGVPILVLGDPAQLPPVKGEGFFIDAEPDILLTEVHRQAAENPIIAMSMRTREGRPLKRGQYGSSKVVDRYDLSNDDLLAADQVLCGLNRTRRRLNHKMRELRGLEGKEHVDHPTVGDRLVCLKNNRQAGLLNGGMWTTLDVEPWKDKVRLRVESLDFPGTVKDVTVLEHFFLGTDEQLDWRRKKDSEEFTFGQVLTVHKAQGSQWDNVVLIDESSTFRENEHRHLYTGETRAAESLTVAQTI